MRIPEGVREVIGRRLNRLSARCNETLTIASVFGREFEFRQLSRLVADASQDRLLEVLEEALSARVIEELPHAVGRYQFTHALLQQTLYEEPSTTRRVQLHAPIAEALEALYGVDADAHATELAYHYAEAEAVTGTEKLAHYSKAAGEQALAAYSYEVASSYCERALASKEDAVLDPETAELMFALGRAQVSSLERPDLQIAVQTLGRAIDYCEAMGDTTKIEVLGEIRVPPTMGVTRTAELYQRGLEIIPPDSEHVARLRMRYGEH